MSNESTVWNILPENSTIPFEAEEQQNGYVLLLVILSIFLVGTIIFTSVLLIFSRRCSHGGQCCDWASDDPEKTTTTYMEESQPTHEITIRVDESECLSMASSHDQETERFLSTGTTGRRVSFNEAALFDHSKKAQEKGRRYTLTEGDFHHLKNARLTNLNIPPPALKIVTIHECDSAENTITMTTHPAAKSALSIFQPMLCPLPQTALTSLSGSPSSALPGDTLNSVVDTSFNEKVISMSLSPKDPKLSSIEMMAAGARGRGSISVGEGPPAGMGASPVGSGAGSQGPMQQFFTKLRRHASLEGASPYLKIKKWKLDSSQRASSLDTRGSPKRRQFQRQRAASESMDQDDNDAHHIDLIQYIARTQDYRPSQTTTRLLSPPSTPPPSLGRVKVEVMVEPSSSHGGPGVIGLSPDPHDEALSLGRRECSDSLDTSISQDPQSLYRDIWTLRATLEQYAASDHSSNNDRNSVCSDADSVCSLGGRTEAERGGLPSYPSQDLGDEAEVGEEDKEFVIHTEENLDRREIRKRKQESTDSEKGSDGETGTRKLLQMDSGYASIEAPCRGPEDFRLFGCGSSSPKDRTAHEKRHHFTSAGRTGTIGESFESHLFEEDPDDELSLGASGGVSIETAASSMSWLPYGQMLIPREATPPPFHPPALHRRDYSIDEKTDVLFHEFLRHDPQFDLQESPLKKHRSRIHLRKQWQRHKQWSDPGVRHFHSSFERQRTPLRRGESVNYPIDTSYHSTLPRIVSAPDEETSDGTGSAPDTPKIVTTTTTEKGNQAPEKEPTTHTSASPPPVHADTEHLEHEEPRQLFVLAEPADERSPPQPHDATGYGPQTITAELTDKLTANLHERLYTGLRRTKDTATECVAVTATHASPDHSPV